MADSEEVQDYLELSDGYLASALSNLDAERYAPAFNHAVHALELALKAAVVAAGGEAGRTHSIAGTFGRHYRAVLDKDTLREINRVLQRYNEFRYPGLGEGDSDEIEEAVQFIASFIEETLPPLLQEGSDESDEAEDDDA